LIPVKKVLTRSPLYDDLGWSMSSEALASVAADGSVKRTGAAARLCWLAREELDDGE